MSEYQENAKQFTHEVTDWDDPKQHLAPFISEWPAFGKMQPMPSPLALVPHQAEHLYRMGVRFHPELAEVVKVQDAEGVTHFVSPEKAEEMRAAQQIAPDEALDLLAKIDPERAERYAGMSEDERLAEVSKTAPEIAEAMKELAKLRAALEEANNAVGA